MAANTGLDQVCQLTRLPYELRQRIFRHALQQNGTIGVQTPLWDNGSAFIQPLFAVCRIFRDEALEAFYRSNNFLWNISRPHSALARPDSDPSKYPLDTPGFHHVMTPSLPWHYPRLMNDLRHLAINVFLPSHNDPYAWWTTLPQELQNVVAALDERGGKLQSLQITIIPSHWRVRLTMSEPYIEVLKTLSQLRVPGKVFVNVRPSQSAVAPSVFAMSLGARSKSEVSLYIWEGAGQRSGR